MEMTKPLISYRRIDQLKAIALDRGFSNEDAKQFGKLSKTATWEALLKTHGIPLQAVDTVDRTVDTNNQSLDTSGWTNDGSFPVCDFTRPNSSFLDWVDFGQRRARTRIGGTVCAGYVNVAANQSS
jgi:hypothetical protein